MARTDISYNNNATDQNQFDRLGHPGKYYGGVTWTGGQLDLTGSNFGYGAFLTSGSDINGNITVAGGATIPINNFSEATIYDVSVSQISGSAGLPGGNVYFFRRQQ